MNREPIAVSSWRSLPAALLGLSMLAASGVAACGEGDPGEPAATVTVEAGQDPGKADGAGGGELKVQVTGMTVWVRPVLRYDEALDRFILAGRASKNVSAVQPFMVDRPLAGGRTVSARKFEVVLEDEELHALLAGGRLFIPVVPEGQAEPTHTALVEVAPRLSPGPGSSLIYLHRQIRAVRVGDEVRYRARATIDPRLSDIGAFNDDDTEPEVSQEDANHYRFEWFSSALRYAASPPEDALHFRGELPTGEVVSRPGQIHFEVVRAGLTNQPPQVAWPERGCESRVRSCLASLGPTVLDTEACGSYRQVTACGYVAPPPVVQKPSIEVVVRDLKRAVVRYHVQHRADIEAAGGATGYEAQIAVTAAGVSEVTDPAEDPEGHDLSRFWVFSHPDTIFPGSDVVWFAAYDRSTGALERVYQFN